MITALHAGFGAWVLGGCASSTRNSYSDRPTAWPGYPAGPTDKSRYEEVRPDANHHAGSTHTDRTHPGSPDTPASGVSALSRSAWTRNNPVSSRVNPMSGVSRITVHHEGWEPVWFNDKRTTAARIEKIRRYHVEDNGWGDIGYHYIVDRAGRVWEGRPLNYQGAHVRNNNEHNIGILVLGNFEKQAPSSAQLKSLYATTAGLSNNHRVSAGRVRSHREINPTTCPGKNLQRQMDALRRHVG